MKGKRVKKIKKRKLPKPGSLDWDYGARMAAAQELIPPNKSICIYCRQQAVSEEKIIHDPECHVPKEKKDE